MVNNGITEPLNGVKTLKVAESKGSLEIEVDGSRSETCAR